MGSWFAKGEEKEPKREQLGRGGDDDGEFTMAELDAAIKERFMHGMGKTKRDKETKSKER